MEKQETLQGEVKEEVKPPAPKKFEEMNMQERAEYLKSERERSDLQYEQNRRTNELAIAIDERGVVKAKNNSELIRFCKAMITSDMVPKRFDTVDKLFGGLMFVRSIGLPDIAIRQVAVIEGVPSLFGDLPLALVQSKGKLFDFDEFVFDKDYKQICFENRNLHEEAFGAVCFGRREKDGKLRSFSFTIDEAKKAKLYPATNRDGVEILKMPWNAYTKRMLVYKARSIMLKSMFADTVNGVGIGEYDFDQVLNLKDDDVENMRDVGPNLNDKLKAQNQDAATEVKDMLREKAGELECTIWPEFKGFKIKEIPENDLHPRLSQTETESHRGKISDELRGFYGSCCMWLGRRQALKDS